MLVWLVSAIVVPVLHQLPPSQSLAGIRTQFSPSFWHGITVYDLVLPMFLFVAGASIVPAFQRQIAAGRTNRQLFWRIVRRVALLVGIGLVCEGGLFQHWPYLRFVGAFQRIAICYAVVAVIDLNTGWRVQTGLLVFLLLDYWVILAFGSAAGSDDAYSLGDNAAACVDNLLLPGRKSFGNWDAQGILTTIPAVAITIAGLLACKVLTVVPIASPQRTRWLFGTGIVAISEGFLWNFACPIDPHLWTPSFCVVTIGVGLALFGLLYAVLDVRGWTIWATPITALGRNSLVLVLATVLLSTITSTATLPALSHRFIPDTTNLAWAMVEVYVLGSLALLLDQRKVSITV